MLVTSDTWNHLVALEVPRSFAGAAVTAVHGQRSKDFADAAFLAGGPWQRGSAAVVNHPGRACRRTPLEGPFPQEMALLLALVGEKYIRKSSITSRDGRI